MKLVDMNNTPFDNIMGTQCGPTDEKNELMPNGQTGEKSGVSRFDIRCAEGGGLDRRSIAAHDC